MINQRNLDKFNRIYDETYDEVLRYVICICTNMNDVNDIIQETYLELWKILNKKVLTEENIRGYLFKIAKFKVKKNSTSFFKHKNISIFSKNDKDIELIEVIEDEIDVESLVIDQLMWDMIWKELKMKKNQDIPKIFYMHYKLDMTLKDIAYQLKKANLILKHVCIEH